MTDYQPALDAALKIAAHDGGSYDLGSHVFWSTLESSQDEEHDLDKAIHFGIFAAMDHHVDTTTFWQAYQAFWDVNEKADPSDDDQSPMDRLTGWLKGKATEAKAKATAPHPPKSDHGSHHAPANAPAPVKRRRPLP